MKTPLTKEIIQDDKLWEEWLQNALYENIKDLLSAIRKEQKIYENEVLNGTGKGEPVGILHA